MGRHSKLRSMATAAREERAQGVIEFALVAMILLLLFAGTVDYGLFLYYDTAVVNAARVGAETAINHCADRYHCDAPSTPMISSVILQKAVCESSPSITLKISGISSPTCTVSSGNPFGAVTVSNCPASGQDICIGGSQTEGGQVYVYVGYSFHPITPIINQFFPTKSCWSTAGGAPNTDSSSNGHTLCSDSTGRIS